MGTLLAYELMSNYPSAVCLEENKKPNRFHLNYGIENAPSFNVE